MTREFHAEVMLRKLLLHNKLITARQWNRMVDISLGKRNKTLLEVILEKNLVNAEHMKKVLSAVDSKGLTFLTLQDEPQTGDKKLLKAPLPETTLHLEPVHPPKN